MITPLTIVDPDAATDHEIIPAYIPDGVDADAARGFLRVLRGELPDERRVDRRCGRAGSISGYPRIRARHGRFRVHD